MFAPYLLSRIVPRSLSRGKWALTISQRRTMTNNLNIENFYIMAHERSTESETPLPLWASRVQNPLQLGISADIKLPVERCEVEGVPGAFQLLNVLSQEECERCVKVFNELGFTEDAPVSLPRSVRHNTNLNWLADDGTLDAIWKRSVEHFVEKDESSGHFQGREPVGLNGRFRVYRYDEGDYFKFHSDGSWAGSRDVEGQHVPNAFRDRWSMYTYLLFLTEGFKGGETQFLVNKNDATKPARTQEEVSVKEVRTPVGGALCFPHGEHPMHCIHSSSPILEGVKFIIRSDVLFML
eukprot:Nitzschia sp. Nitz4//scaffold268_size26297//19605//20577//NITZ4_008281-RA/size26297-processed-gene-0.10-mRNA-1//1//CDS//3329544942//4830//frame0